jgi:crotonobetainyl-CoA:carnitine CoA-transferase CaiB-like acyl-CoA transferase
MSELMLKGVRVLDFSRVLAGPLCTQYLGDYGAEVVKVESLNHGDDMRVWPPYRKSDDGKHPTGTPFLAWNRNKRGIALDLKSPASRPIVEKLIRNADVVIESFGPGAGARLGIDAASVHAINPRIVHCSISGFGTQGSMRKGKGYDIILQAFCGIMSQTGESDGGPVRTVFSPIDQGTGMHALSGILAGLFARERTGKGTAIEVSLFDTGTAYLSHILQNFWERGTEPERFGVGHESLCPYEDFQTSDKPLILGVANDRMWKSFCKLAGIEQYADDPRFLTNGDRVRNRKECVAIVQDAMRSDTRDRWLERLTSADIPCSPMHTLEELTAHPHTRESGMVFDYQHPTFGPMSAVAQPVRVNGQRASMRRAPPLRGQHTTEVLSELGLSDEEIAALIADGVACTAN